MKQQARNFCMVMDESKERYQYLIHDRDGCFVPFDGVLACEDLKIVKTPPRAPMCNAFAERHVREIRETLNSMILMGEGHLYYVLKKVERHHNGRRPHQGIENGIPMGFVWPDDPGVPGNVKCQSTLGGLLNHYYVEKAA